VYARGEAEFAALDATRAAWRIASGRAWFSARGWPLSGFVAPAWLLGPGAWHALREEPGVQAPSFLYTTTWTRLHWLHPARSLWAPSLVYTARNRAGRVLSPGLIDLARLVQRDAPLVRLGLHPADARHPALLRHMQRVLTAMLRERDAVTKVAFAHQYGPQNPPPRQCPGP
jgi:predicted deacetylase